MRERRADAETTTTAMEEEGETAGNRRPSQTRERRVIKLSAVLKWSLLLLLIYSSSSSFTNEQHSLSRFLFFCLIMISYCSLGTFEVGRILVRCPFYSAKDSAGCVYVTGKQEYWTSFEDDSRPPARIHSSTASTSRRL